jgi:hypothetical protein
MTTETEISAFTTLLITRLQTTFDDFVAPKGKLGPLLRGLEAVRNGNPPPAPFSLLPKHELEAIKAAYNKALLAQFEVQLVRVLAGDLPQWKDPVSPDTANLLSRYEEVDYVGLMRAKQMMTDYARQAGLMGKQF